MRIHYLQHVPFENPGNIIPWADAHGHLLSGTSLYNDEPLPPITSFDWLVILGGPMNIYEHDQYPWLVREKQFISETIKRGALVLGICLGAQLLADVLGGRISRNSHREIGWFPVSLTPHGKQSAFFPGFDEQFLAFHWHGDAFSIPPGTDHLVENEACENQAFQYGNRVLGLQFHLDYSIQSVETMIRNCGDELTPGSFIQSPREMLALPERFQTTQTLLNKLLDAMAEQI